MDRKLYDKLYRLENREYANFRAVKCTYLKKFSKKEAEKKLLKYVLKKKLRGEDMSLLLAPSKRINISRGKL